MGHAKELAYVVPYVLEAPTAIFEGLREEMDEDHSAHGWRCYCGVPKCSYGAEGEERPPRRGQVFLVFVNDKGIAYNWRWEKADDMDDKLPIDYRIRFKEKVL